LRFIERESGAKIGMVSTGPERDQTMLLPEFSAEIVGAAEKSPAEKPAPQKSAKAK